jgi:hypothetical protein
VNEAEDMLTYKSQVDKLHAEKSATDSSSLSDQLDYPFIAIQFTLTDFISNSMFTLTESHQQLHT